MLCQRCHKNLATVRYAEVVSGRVTDLHLCPECLSRQQDSAGGGFELSSPVTVHECQAPRDHVGPSRPKPSTRVCKACGFQLAWAMDMGRVGCSQCYDAFADDVEPILLGLHNAARHCGKAPRVDDARAQLRASLQTQRSLLRSAVQSENYEEAAQIRDVIRQYEMRLGNVDSGRN